MPLFSKEEIIARIEEKRVTEGAGSIRADFNLALVILGAALFEQRLKSGHDYGEHPVHVGMHNTRSTAKRIIGLLHDVVEDSDWTCDDLRRVGFSERIVSAVEALTHTKTEPYFDAIERCSKNTDATDKKIEDLSHNMDVSRNEILPQENDMERLRKYSLARAFLVAVKRRKIEPGASLPDFVKGRSDLISQRGAESLLKKYSSHP